MAIALRFSKPTLSVSDSPTKCKFCERSGLSALELFSRRPMSQEIGRMKEYKIEHDVLLVNSNALNNVNCPLCRMILSRLPESRLLHIKPQTKPARLVIRDSSRVHVSGVITQDWHLSILSDRRNCGCLRSIQPGPTGPVLSRESHIDFPQISIWLKNCEANHGSECNLWEYATARYRLPIDMLLIDVVHNCLVEAESDWRYVALSYVWGSVTMLAAAEENIVALQQPGSLGPQATLPVVIQDAMESVRRIGERYLWVDRLCIKQNSAGKHKELARMDIIFSHALLTIAAIDGTDAGASLPGVRPESRLPVQRLESIQDNLFISEPPPLQRFLKDCIYETRGWTFQERCFSTRILYFSEQQIYFQCQRSIRSESHVQERPYWSVSNRVNKIRLRGSWRIDFLNDDSIPDRIPKQYWLSGLPVYQDLVETYSSRKLTYTMDVISAFAGFSSVFEECCGGPIFSAIPMAALGAALLWIGCDGIQRRMVVGSVIFPSWSWAGWEGPVRYPILMRVGPNAPVYSRLENAAIYTTTATEEPQDFNDVSQSNNPVIHINRRDQNYPSHPVVDLLHFSAPTTSFNSFELHDSRSRIKDVTYCFLTPRDSTTSCGVIFGISVASAKLAMPGSMELVLLSHDFIPTSSAQLHASYGVSIPATRNEKQGAAHHTLNVLLVKYSGDYYERVAIGKMYSEAWSALGQEARMKRVVLA